MGIYLYLFRGILRFWIEYILLFEFNFYLGINSTLIIINLYIRILSRLSFYLHSYLTGFSLLGNSMDILPIGGQLYGFYAIFGATEAILLPRLGSLSFLTGSLPVALILAFYASILSLSFPTGH